METKYVAYYRVSTKKQGHSGLGLEAQKQSVYNFVNCQNCIIAEFTEIESGKNDNRIELNKAIEVCKKNGAKLVIAKLDRLSRNVSFISSLMDSKVNFICVDMPEANEFTIHIFAALAQQERKMISERTKKGLAQSKKAKGFNNPIIKESVLKNATENTKKARNAYSEKSKTNENNLKSFELINLLYNQMTLQQIADKLNKAGFKTAKGNKFNPIQVKRIYEKYSK